MGALSPVCSELGDETSLLQVPAGPGFLQDGADSVWTGFWGIEACAAGSGLRAVLGRLVKFAEQATALNPWALSLQGTLHPPAQCPPRCHPVLELPTQVPQPLAHGSFLSPVLLRLPRESGPREKTPKPLGRYCSCAPPLVTQARVPGLGPGVGIRTGGDLRAVGPKPLIPRTGTLMSVGTSACSFMAERGALPYGTVSWTLSVEAASPSPCTQGRGSQAAS